MKENIGLYRDDGLGISRNISRPEIERKKKDLIRIFKNHGLSITVKTIQKVAEFFDIHFIRTFINHIRNRTTSLYALIRILTIPKRL